MPTEPLADVEETLALSPDGHSIAYIAGNPSRRIYVRDIDRYESTPIAGTDGADGVAFSADGRSLAFLADRKLKTVTLAAERRSSCAIQFSVADLTVSPMVRFCSTPVPRRVSGVCVPTPTTPIRSPRRSA